MSRSVIISSGSLLPLFLFYFLLLLFIFVLSQGSEPLCIRKFFAFVVRAPRLDLHFVLSQVNVITEKTTFGFEEKESNRPSRRLFLSPLVEAKVPPSRRPTPFDARAAPCNRRTTRGHSTLSAIAE